MKKQILFLLAAILFSWSSNAQMILEFNTNLSDGTTITLPLYGTVDVTVNWGDESSDAYTAVGNQEHTYAAEGTYTVSINGSLTQFGNGFTVTNNINKLIKVTSFGDIGITSLFGAFLKATNLVELPLLLPSTVQNISAMVTEASKFNGDITSWDVSSVTDMSYVFKNAAIFNQDIGGWDVSNVTDMKKMFTDADVFNQDISSWDVSKVTKMANMFRYTLAFNQDIGGWDVSNVTDMNSMFLNASVFNQDISSWDVSIVTNMASMFYSAFVFNQDISSWDVSNVTDMKNMFRIATAFDQNIGSWNVSNVTDMTDMFKEGALPTANYNNLLIGWAAQTLQNGVTFHGGNSKYSPGAAADARAVLTGTYSWIITDGGVLNVLTVLTIAPSEITATTATSGGNIIADGGSPVTARGVVWGETENPTIETNTGITTDGAGIGIFTSNLTGLTENTTYHVRAYATNTNGTEYGENMEFIAKGISPVFTVTFTVTDNSVPLAGASISINEQTLTTDAEGIATIELENGVYPYSVSATDFVTHEGSITVTGEPVQEDVLFVHVGVNTGLLSNIRIYPNPTNGILKIDFGGERVQTMRILDVTGKTILEKANVSPSETIDISNFANGLYLMLVQTDKKSVSYKIIKD